MSNESRKVFYQIIAVLSGLFLCANLLGSESCTSSSLCGLIFGFALGRLDAIYEGESYK